MEKFLATMTPMRAAKARAALEMQVRVNGAGFMTRQALIEREVLNGRRIELSKKGARMLVQPVSGAFFDERAITVTGMDYARFLLDAAQ